MKQKARSSMTPSNKGKGGGKPRSVASSPTKGKESKGSKSDGKAGETIDIKECPLSFPQFVAIDPTKTVPRYSAVLRRSEQDGIGLEDLDTLQLELEALLSSVVVKKTTLKEECKILGNIDKYKGQSKLKKGPSSPGKRGLSSKEDRLSKKLKLGPGKPVESKVIGVPKIKSDAVIPSFDPLQNEQIRPVAESSKPALPKNETPNRFWAFVEPYCAPITVDDIKLLEDLIKTHGDLSEYYRIPPLGQHYTQRWAKEDLENERIKSSSDPNDKTDEAGKILKKGEGINEESPYGELTQRIVQGLIEENCMTSVDDSMDASKKSGDSDTENSSKGQLIKSLNINNAEALEARVRKELEEQGIINPNEDGNEDENDEILDELKRCQNELRAVSAHNLQQLKRLLKAAKEEMVRQELRNKLQQADNEVMDAYRKISQARSKKKPPSKKERDQAWKALKERELILKQLESA